MLRLTSWAVATDLTRRLVLLQGRVYLVQEEQQDEESSTSDGDQTRHQQSQRHRIQGRV